MAATGIVFVFSALSAASSGKGLRGMLAMLSACRYVGYENLKSNMLLSGLLSLN